MIVEFIGGPEDGRKRDYCDGFLPAKYFVFPALLTNGWHETRYVLTYRNGKPFYVFDSTGTKAAGKLA